MKTIASIALALSLASTSILPAVAGNPTLKQVIAQAIANRAPAPGRYEVMLAAPDSGLEAAAGDERKLERLNYNPANQSFQATFVYRNDLGNEERVSLAGTAWAVISVPTLVQDVVAGDTISSASLTSIEVPANRVASTMITAPDVLAGQVARRSIRAGTALFAMDFSKPVAVKKGDTITIIAERPGIRLSAQGKAMSNGSKGDIVTFMNTTSRRQVDARIVDAGTAVITTSTRTAAIN